MTPLEEAIQHFDDGEYGAAVALFRRVVEGQPDNADAQMYLAATYYRVGRYNLAANPARACVAQRPADPAGQYLLGMVLQRLNRSREARAAFGAAAAADASPPTTQAEVGRLLGEPPDAIALAPAAERRRRPRWLVPLLSAGVVVAAAAIVFAIFLPYRHGPDEPKPPPQPVTPLPAPEPQPSIGVVPGPAPQPTPQPTPAPAPEPLPPALTAAPAPNSPSDMPAMSSTQAAATATIPTLCPTCGGLGVVPAQPGEPGAFKCPNPLCDHGRERCPYHPPFCPVDYGDDCPLCDGTRYVGTCEVCKGTGYVKWCPTCKGKQTIPLPVPAPPPGVTPPADLNIPDRWLSGAMPAGTSAPTPTPPSSVPAPRPGAR